MSVNCYIKLCVAVVVFYTCQVSRLPAWKQSLSAEAREAEKLAFSELQRKTNFLPTQRCSSATQGHMASSGPLKMMGKVDASSKKKTSLFAARPSKVVFTDYRPGEAYEVHYCMHASHNVI